MDWYQTPARRAFFFALSGALLLLLIGLQYRLWGEWQQISRYEQKIAVQMQENQHLLERNRWMEAEIHDLKQGTEALEEHARYDLGLLKDDEVFYYVRP